MQVIFADWLKQNFLSFDENLRSAVVDFAVHMEENGIKGLQGRNKSSVLPNPTTKKRVQTRQIRPKILSVALSSWHSRIYRAKKWR